MTSILTAVPPPGTIPYGEVVYVDDGTEPLGTIEQITGGSESRGIPRTEVETYDPRLFSHSNVPSPNVSTSNVDNFLSDMFSSIDTTQPIKSVHNFIKSHEDEYKNAISDINNLPGVEHLVFHADVLGQKLTQLLGSAVAIGTESSLLSEAIGIAQPLGLSTGTAITAVEAAVVALSIGGMAHGYDALTGDNSVLRVENHLKPLFTQFTTNSIHTSNF